MSNSNTNDLINRIEIYCSYLTQVNKVFKLRNFVRTSWQLERVCRSDIDAVGNRLEIPAERSYINIDRFGNTSSASIPIALDEAVRTSQTRCSVSAWNAWM